MQKGLRGVGSALCPPPLAPPHGPQSREGYTSRCQQGGGGSESSRPVSFLRNLHPPPTIPAPGESTVLACPQRRGPVQMGSYGRLTYSKGVARLEIHVCMGCIEALGD